MQIEGEKVEAVTEFVLLSFKITADGDCSHEIKRFPWKESYDIPRVYSQRYHFTDKGPYGQSFGFSRSHVQM